MKPKEEILSDYIDLARAEYPDQNWMSNEEILESPENRFMIMAMEEYGNCRHDQAIHAAIKKITDFYGKNGLTNTGNRIKEEILKMLTQ